MQMTLVDESKDIFPPVIKPITGLISVAYNKRQYLDLCKENSVTQNWMWNDDDVIIFHCDGSYKVL